MAISFPVPEDPPLNDPGDAGRDARAAPMAPDDPAGSADAETQHDES